MLIQKNTNSKPAYIVFLKKSEINTMETIYIVECEEDDRTFLTITLRKNGKPFRKKEKIIIQMDDLEKDPLEKIPVDAVIYVQKRAEQMFKHTIVCSKIFKECGGDVDKILSAFDRISNEVSNDESDDDEDLEDIGFIDLDEFN